MVVPWIAAAFRTRITDNPSIQHAVQEEGMSFPTYKFGEMALQPKAAEAKSAEEWLEKMFNCLHRSLFSL